MELVRGLHNLTPAQAGCVATIGNFDGVHLGHKAVLAQLQMRARERGLPSVVVIFEPQPVEFLARDRAPPRLTRLREKLRALALFPLDRVLCLRFDRRLAALPAEAFVDTVLVHGLGVRHLVVGDDFRFGAGRRGDFALLECMGHEHGFAVERTASFSLDGERVSSTSIREALAAGDLGKAERFLGRPYRVCGRVAHGDKRGRLLGFPTANVALHRRSSPVEGVFAVRVHGVCEGPVAGVANVGFRPTVDGTRAKLEVHLFDFDGDLYGRYVQIDFLKKLRPERRFESLEALTRQIEMDAREARAFFADRA